jgi:hypothetical protein
MNRNIPIGSSMRFVRYFENGRVKHVEIRHLAHNTWLYVQESIDPARRQIALPAAMVYTFYRQLVNGAYIPMPRTPVR